MPLPPSMRRDGLRPYTPARPSRVCPAPSDAECSEGGTMLRNIRSLRRRVAIAAVVMATAFAASAVTAAPGGAKSSGGKVDKSAVLRFGVPLEDNGGVFFNPTGNNATAQSPTNRLFLD